MDRLRILAAAVVIAIGCSHPARALNVAISNDDGWDAPGIQALKDVLLEHGHSVVLAAPLDQQNGSSAALDLGPLVVTRERENEYSVSVDIDGNLHGAKPASSALIAIDISTQLNEGAGPDLLVSGIDADANVGAATVFSGTVGAAIAAVSRDLNGEVPAIAISTSEPDCGDSLTEEECLALADGHYRDVAAFIAEFIAHLETRAGFLHSVTHGLRPRGWVLNINYPGLAPDAVKGVRVSRQGMRFDGGSNTLVSCPGCLELEDGESADGGISGAVEDDSRDVPNSDVVWFNKGFITVVPLTPDYTARAFKRFRSVVNGFGKAEDDGGEALE